MNERREHYLYGGCYLLACAIHDRTGWEIVSTWVESAKNPAGEEHVMVRLPDGRLLDAAGLHDPDGWHVFEERSPEYHADDAWQRRHVTREVRADADDLLAELGLLPAPEAPQWKS